MSHLVIFLGSSCDFNIVFFKNKRHKKKEDKTFSLNKQVYIVLFCAVLPVLFLSVVYQICTTVYSYRSILVVLYC